MNKSLILTVNFTLLLTLTFSPLAHTYAETGETESSYNAHIASIIHSIQNLVATVTVYLHPQLLLDATITVDKTVVADFATVDYYPNLKSKIGFADNASDNSGDEFTAKLNEIGPGMFCSNVEFDFRYKHPGDISAALLPAIAMSTTTAMLSTPSNWLKNHETKIGDLNISQLEQITGAPNQYMPLMNQSRSIRALHQIPTDVGLAADFTSEWASNAQHNYPIMWSIWNEPGHTFMGLDRNYDLGGFLLKNPETPSEFDVRNTQSFTDSADKFGKLYNTYNSRMRPTIGSRSQVGLASFLGVDFNPDKLTTNNDIYFKAVLNSVTTPIDYVTFNSFGGGWVPALSGARAVLSDTSHSNVPVIFTQYAPGGLKVSASGDLTDYSVSPMAVATEMLTDLAQLERASDVRALCMSYWAGEGAYTFVKSSGNQPRFEALKLFAELPIVRTAVNVLGQTNVHALAGINQKKASVLLWNDGASTITVPLVMKNVPNAITGTGARTVTIKSISSIGVLTTSSPTKLLTDDLNGRAENYVLTPNSVMLVEQTAADVTITDPLARRNSIVSNIAGRTRFLQTKSVADRVPDTCTTVTKIPNVSTCAKNTGTYGFYDSVRSVAYLGRGTGTSPATVSAMYSDVPEKLYVNATVYTGSEFTVAPPMSVTAEFALCDNQVNINPDIFVTTTPKNMRVLDFSTVPAFCRAGNATLTFTLVAAAPQGTQAEIYLSSNQSEANNLADHNEIRVSRPSSDTIDTFEHLVVVPFFDVDTVKTESLNGNISWALGDSVCTSTAYPKGYPGCKAGKPFFGTTKLLKIIKTTEPLPTQIIFATDSTGGFKNVRAPRGDYTLTPKDSNVACTFTDKDPAGISVSHDKYVSFMRGVTPPIIGTCTVIKPK